MTENTEAKQTTDTEANLDGDSVVMPDELIMNAYYYGFDSTGERAVDEILSAVAMAGKGCHNTSEWDDYHPLNTDLTYVDLMQDRAKVAAKKILYMEGLLEEAHKRFRDYQMDVDSEAPQAHKDFMKRLSEAVGA